MSNEIELISDGDGLAVIGSPTDVERFLLEQGLSLAPSRELDLHRVRSALGTSGALAQAGSEVAANSGRWVRLTKDSAAAVKKYGLMPSKKGGIGHAMIGPRPGHSQQWLQIDKMPALLAGPMAPVVFSTMMQQQAMQQQMDEIVEYLQEINEKVDDVLRGQKDAVLADMIGIDLVIEEAWTVRNQVGRVSEVTWSKVQGTSTTIARTQGYVLRQLDAIAEKLHKKTDPGDLAKAAKDAEARVREWLAVLARCFQLEDAIAVLELDRVLDTSPEELDQHRLGLAAARDNRRELIARGTARLLTEMDETVGKANSKVLFNPIKSPAAVKASSQVALSVLDFRGRLGIESEDYGAEAKRWAQAAAEVRDEVLATTVEGLDAARRYGAEAIEHAVGACREVDTARAMSAMGDAGSAIKSATASATDALGAGASSAGSAIGELANGATSAVSSLLRRRRGAATTPGGIDSEDVGEHSELPSDSGS